MLFNCVLKYHGNATNIIPCNILFQVAEITFNLWYRLSEEIYNRDYQALTDKFKPHIERLIEALTRHCQCEPDHTRLLDEGDEFYVG